MTQEQHPETNTTRDRIDYKGPLAPVVTDICDTYSLGAPLCFSIMDTGYEDYNVHIGASKGEYVAKIFAQDVTPDTLARYSEMMERVTEVGINHPTLHKTKDGKYIHKYNKEGNLSMVLMDYIEGKTFGELDLISRADIAEVLRQASLLHNLDYKPQYINDTWAVQNIETLYTEVAKYIPLEEKALVSRIIEKFHAIPKEKLPHCLVHGDLHKANIIKGNDGKIYPIDFSVANYYPRIQELAVISANLLYHNRYGKSLKETSREVAEIYGRFNPLTVEERFHLYVYTLAVKAMGLLGGCKEKYINGNNNAETEKWIRGTSEGLRREFSGQQKSAVGYAKI